MVIRKFKAKIVDDFYNEWLNVCAKDEGVDIAATTKSYGGEDLKKLAERISGNVVTLIENKYPKGSMDYFEEIDNNFVIFPELFEEISCL